MRSTFRLLSVLVWLTQLGLSVLGPLAVWLLLAVWLRNRFGWGHWVLFAGLALGLIGAVMGLISSLRLMNRTVKEDPEQGVNFNDHD